MPRRLLVVINTDIPEGVLRALVHSRAGEDAEMLVVAPASELSRLSWLTNAEDDARSAASSLAHKTAVSAPTEDVESRVGDSDPLQAIADALAGFAADEILVVGHSDEEAGWLEEGRGAEARARFDLPITRVTVAESGALARHGG